MSFDDLAFPSGSVVTVSKRCPACEEVRSVDRSTVHCPSCGERMQEVSAAEAESMAGGMAHVLQAVMREAAAASSVGAHAAADDGGGSGLAGRLQGLFSSQRDTFSDMANAQRGFSIEELMQRSLNEPGVAVPASVRFRESLQERTLEARDFIQLYLEASVVERPLFPTMATFGTSGKFIADHAEAQAELDAREQAEKLAAATPAAAAATLAAAAAAPVAATAAAATAPPLSAAIQAQLAALEDSDEERPPRPPQEHASSALVIASPLTGKPPFANARAMRGAWVLLQRGGTSFAAKARAAQDVLARGIVVMQSEPDSKAWPYTMNDSTNTSADIVIPALMISQSDGEVLQAAMAKAGSAEITLRVMTRERPLACSVCRDDYRQGKSAAVELPCHHYFCYGCIMPWIEKRASCPTCRLALPTDAPKKKEDMLGPDSNHAQLQRDMFT